MLGRDEQANTGEPGSNALHSSRGLGRVSTSMAVPDNCEFGRVRRAAKKLKPLERDLLIMSAGRGLPAGDIASLLGMNERRVVRLLAIAIYKFDCALEREGRFWWHFW